MSDGWSVLVEIEAPEGEHLRAGDRCLDALADVLIAEHHGIITGSATGWSARISVDDFDPVHADWQAVEAGRRIVMGMAEKVGLPDWPVVRLEAVREDVLDAELERSNFPDVVGTQEVTKLLDVSRQRLHELRHSGRFPTPMIELAAGPIWLRTAIDSFLDHWARKPGRTSRYDALREYLEDRTESAVRLTFAEIERIIGGPLPASARKHPAWWANEKAGSHAHAQSWLDIGRRTAKVDLNGATVEFVK